MPKKIENKLREGQPSKIYFYAFSKPISGYKLAAIITGRSPPITARIYTTLKKMIDEKLIFRLEKEGYQSNPKPLVEEITKILDERREKLTDIEKLCVRKILENSYFKEMMSIAAERRGESKDIDAAREACHILAISSIIPYLTFRGIDAVARRMAEKSGEEYIGFLDQDIKAPVSENPLDQFHYYLRPNLTRKLLKLLPVDLQEKWDIIAESVKRVASSLKTKGGK